MSIRKSNTLKSYHKKSSQLTEASDNMPNIFKSKDSKDLNNPHFSMIPLTRASFELTSPPLMTIRESSSIPSLPKSSQLHLKLLEDMQKMVPRSVKNRKSMRLCLRTSIRQLNTLKLRPDELALVNKLIPQIPYGRPASRTFFQYVKEGNAISVEQMLTEDKYLAHVFDQIKMTALHWAALRGYIEIVKLLLSYSAFVDALDIV
jgi:hypothetical protein